MEFVSGKMEQAVEAMFDNGEGVVVGVSGGADSMTLLECLRKSKKNLKIVVAHLNHKLRGAQGDGDEAFVRQWCLKHRLKFVSKSVDISKVAKAEKISVELAGRKERYKFFYSFGCKIATAHTLSDRVETLVFNITRGCGLNGLCSILAIRGKIVRPLLQFTRSEIELYCKENGVPFRIDSSNLSLKHDRNKIRLEVVPRLKRLNSGFESNALRMFRCLESDEAYFSEEVSKVLKKVLVNNMLKFSEVILLHRSISARVVVEFLKLNGVSPSFDLVYRILSYDGKHNFQFNILNKKMVCFEKNLLIIKSVFKSNEFDVVLPNSIAYCYKSLWFYRLKFEHFNYFLNKTSHIFLFKIDYDKIKGLIHVRSRVSGDKIALVNRPTKKLKCLMQEAKIPVERRGQLVVLADDEGPFWVESFGVAKRVAVDDETKNLMLILKKK